ncbi:HU family DNA-binding protein [Bacteroides sp.]|uniref:HU family DNA-binding protein n=1 Tax=Bacteroides sp. TaxID=29523 RepID=UPI002608C148|nr:HU family DNA-binding protein [Bacteroides sp.]MDD3037646.1 HU family DNA-binding protein [Bacteroides sp.]
MNERLTIQDLIDLLAARHSMTKKDAEAFVKEFFLLIEQALEDEKYLKIKGLGTFKLVDVDSRESVNVNTGERIQIQGHTKVSFTPDANMRDAINKPFSHFETVVLNENTVLDDTQIEEPEEDEAGEGAVVEVLENKNKVTDQTQYVISDTKKTSKINKVAEALLTAKDENKSDEQFTLVQKVPIAEELATRDNVGNESETEESAIENKIVREEIIEEPKEEGTLSKITKVEKTVMQPEELEATVSEQQPQSEEGKKEDPTAETIIARELARANLDSVLAKPQSGTVHPEAVTKVIVQKEKSPVPYLIAVIIIVLLLCGGAILYIYYPDLFMSSPNKDNTIDMPVTTQPVEPEAQLLDSIEKEDTVATVIPNTPKMKEEAPVSQPVTKKEVEISVKKDSKTTQEELSSPIYSDSASYTITGTKVTHTVQQGETLTKISLRYFGTKGMWPYIVKHNPEVIKNPDNVPYGTKIKIPELTKK